MKADTKAFDRAAHAYGLRLRRGVYGELLEARARFAWWFFYAGWRMRRVYEKNREERRKCS